MKNTDDIAYVRNTLKARAICVVIPTYNNVGTVGRVVSDALSYCDDVIVVSDGSDDGTTEALQQMDGITLVAYKRNRGKGYALKQGFRKAMEMGFAYAITMDADGQHFATDIPAMLSANHQWPGSIILGSRRMEGADQSRGSSFANRFSNFWFALQTGHREPDTQTGYRLYPLRKLVGLSLLTSRYEAELELLVLASWSGVEVHSVPVSVYYPPRSERVSHFRPGRDFARISVLNTVLCLLSVVYGWPRFMLRKLATLLRTAVALVFFLVLMMVIITPSVWVYVHLGPMTELKKWRIHLLIYRWARIITRTIGIPGARYSSDVSAAADFTTPRVIVCNHQSHLDLIYLLSLSPRMVFLTNDWVWRNPFYGFMIRHAEYYPASRGIANLMPQFRSLVSRGYSLAIFPEGTRSRDCRIGRFHQGAFFVARQLGLGIQPVFLYGTGRVLKKKTYHLEKSPVYMEVGRPISAEEQENMGDVMAETRHFHHLYLRHFEEISNRIEQDV